MSARHAFPRCFLQPRTQLRFVRPTLACCGSICSSCDSSCPTHSPFCGPKYSAPQGGWHFAGAGLILRRHAAFLAPVLHLIAACRRMYLFVPIAQARGGMSCLLSHVCQRHAPPLPSSVDLTYAVPPITWPCAGLFRCGDNLPSTLPSVRGPSTHCAACRHRGMCAQAGRHIVGEPDNFSAGMPLFR